MSEHDGSTTPPAVLAVVVNWNGKDHLLACLASLQAVDYPAGRLDVLVVDNASTDGSQAAVKEAYPEFSLFESGKNLGYARAANRGVEHGLELGVDYIWMFNNDVVVERDSLRTLVGVGEQDESIGVIGPVIYSGGDPDTVEHAGYSICFLTGRMPALTFGRDVFAGEDGRTADVDSIIGCSNLIKTSVFRKVGLFRTVYEIYFEETDFNVRARRSGFRVVLARDAKVVHKGAATMNQFMLRRAWLLLRNLFLFEVLNARLRHLLAFVPYFFLVHLPTFLIRGGLFAVKVKLAALGRKRTQS